MSAPQRPDAPDASVLWLIILCMMSLCLIEMARGCPDSQRLDTLRTGGL